MKGPDKPKWQRSFLNKIGCLIQEIWDIKGTNTYSFIQKYEVTKGRKVTYSHIVCNIRPQKTETYRVQLTVGGDTISYEGPLSTHTADLTTSKLHWKSLPSKPYGKYLIVDVKNFYLNNTINKSEHLKIALKIIPKYIIKKYDLLKKQRGGYIYVRIKKEMYGAVLL